MVQEIKINDDYTIQFQDITSAEYVELTMSIDDILKEDYEKNSDYRTAIKLNEIKFLNKLGNKIFRINNEEAVLDLVPPYMMQIVHDLANGYLSDIRSKKAWDLKGGEIKLDELRQKESTLKVSTKNKEKLKSK